MWEWYVIKAFLSALWEVSVGRLRKTPEERLGEAQNAIKAQTATLKDIQNAEAIRAVNAAASDAELVAKLQQFTKRD